MTTSAGSRKIARVLQAKRRETAAARAHEAERLAESGGASSSAAVLSARLGHEPAEPTEAPRKTSRPSSAEVLAARLGRSPIEEE